MGAQEPRNWVSCREGELGTHQASSLSHGDGTASPSAAQQSWRAEWRERTLPEPWLKRVRARHQSLGAAPKKQPHPPSSDHVSLAPPAGPSCCVPERYQERHRRLYCSASSQTLGKS